MLIQDLFEDSSLSLELEKIKEKIAQLYNQMIEKAYRLENPGASPEDIEAFLEENSLEFAQEESGLEEEIDSLDNMLEDLLDPTDDLDPVTEKSYSNPTVETGKELKSKTNEKGNVPLTTNLPEPKGLMSTPADVKREVHTQKVEIQRGKQKTSKLHSRPDFSNIGPLVEHIQSKLAGLKQRQQIGRKQMEDRL